MDDQKYIVDNKYANTMTLSYNPDMQEFFLSFYQTVPKGKPSLESSRVPVPVKEHEHIKMAGIFFNKKLARNVKEALTEAIDAAEAFEKNPGGAYASLLEEKFDDAQKE